MNGFVSFDNNIFTMSTTLPTITTIFCALLCFEISAQNLLANGDFENYSSLPNSSMDWSYCVGWNNVNLNTGAWPYATPDYFHTMGTGGGQLPNCAFGSVMPQSGNAVVGLYSKHSSQTNTRDYVSAQLTTPLTVGTAYSISFWISNGYGNYYYGSSCSHMGIQLSTSPLTQATHENIGGTPQLEVTGSPWLTGWNMYSTVYVATAPHQYVTIGVFRDDASVSTSLHESGANYPSGAYYFVDNVVIEQTSLLPIELLSFDAIRKSHSVDLEWKTNSERENDYFTIERSTDLTNWTTIERMEGAGTTNEVQSYSLKDENPLEGLAYYRLSQTDFNGKVNHSDIRSVNFIREGDIVLYPVPANEFLVVHGNSSNFGKSNFVVIDASGKDLTSLVDLVEGTDDKLVLNVERLSGGYYFIKVQNAIERFQKK